LKKSSNNSESAGREQAGIQFFFLGDYKGRDQGSGFRDQKAKAETNLFCGRKP
jgi:hypothetical protein